MPFFLFFISSHPRPPCLHVSSFAPRWRNCSPLAPLDSAANSRPGLAPGIAFRFSLVIRGASCLSSRFSPAGRVGLSRTTPAHTGLILFSFAQSRRSRYFLPRPLWYPVLTPGLPQPFLSRPLASATLPHLPRLRAFVSRLCNSCSVG